MTRKPPHSLVHHAVGCKNIGIDYCEGSSRVCPWCRADMTRYATRYAKYLDSLPGASPADEDGACSGWGPDCEVTIIS